MCCEGSGYSATHLSAGIPMNAGVERRFGALTLILGSAVRGAKDIRCTVASLANAQAASGCALQTGSKPSRPHVRACGVIVGFP